MSYHLKYRPDSLDEMYGNETTISTLKGMLKKDFPHSMLFYGTTGCGKTTLARILANELDCAPGDVVEYNSANFRGIDTIRKIAHDCQFPPLGSPIKVYIIDECHKLTGDAQTAFLKTLEDTPDHVYFFLCTTHPQKLLREIRNRCSPIQVDPLNSENMMALFQHILEEEGESIKDEILDVIIKQAEGIPRMGLQKLKQVVDTPRKKRMKIARKAIEEDTEAYELCKMLMSKKATWDGIRKILNGMNRAEYEGARRSVMGYATNALLKYNDNPKAGLILEEFCEPMYDAGFPALVRACYAVYKA